MTWAKVEKRAKVTSGTNAVFNGDGIRPTQWVSETQWSATLFRLPVTRAKGDKQKGSNKKKDVKQSSFCCDLQAKSPAVVEVTGFEPMASWSRTKRATNCATPRNSVLAKYSVFSILQLTAHKRASALRAMLLWTRYKQHTVLICYTLSPNCATPRNSVLAKYSVFSILQLTAHKRASALRAMLLWTRYKQHTVLFCYTLSPNCATPKHLPQRNDGTMLLSPFFRCVQKATKTLPKKAFPFLPPVYYTRHLIFLQLF